VIKPVQSGFEHNIIDPLETEEPTKKIKEIGEEDSNKKILLYAGLAAVIGVIFLF